MFSYDYTSIVYILILIVNLFPFIIVYYKNECKSLKNNKCFFNFVMDDYFILIF